MKNYVQPGNTITLTAPYTVASGDGLLVGSIFGIAAGALPTVATTIFLFAGQRNQDLASSVYVVTFQVGIASGSPLGAAPVDLGYLGGTLLSTAVLGALAFTVMATRSRSLLR